MLPKLLTLLVSGFFFFSFVPRAFATLYINEFGSSDDPDWVEIYNSGPSSADLSLYRLEDLAANALSLTGTIGAGGFLSFDWSNRLNNTGDTVKLILVGDSSIVDSVVYGSGGSISAPSAGQSGGRQTDGGSSWVIFTASSKGATNNSSVPTPSPTSSPTPTPSPVPTNTNTPTPTSANTPTPTNTPSPTKKPTSSPTPTKSKLEQVEGEENTPTPEIILGASSKEISLEQEPAEDKKGQSLGKSFIAGGLALIGFTFLGLSTYSLFKGESGGKKSATIDSDEIS